MKFQFSEKLFSFYRRRTDGLPFFLLFLFIAFFWLLIFKPNDGLWYDECFTLFHSQGTNESIFNVSMWDSNPPLYLFIVKKWLLLVGYSEFKLRLLSLIFLSIFIATGSVWVKSVFGRTAGIFVFILLCFSEISIEYAHEARVYSFIFFLVTLSSLLTIKLILKPNILLAIILGIINSLIFYSHYIEGIIFLIQAVFILFVFISKDFCLIDKLKIGLYFSICGSIFIYYLDKWKILFLPLLEKGGNNIVPPPILSDIPRVLSELLNHNLIFLILTCIILVIGFIFNVNQKTDINKQQKWMMVFYLLFIVISFSTIFLLSYKSPMFSRRYLMFNVFPILVLFSVYVNQIKSNKFKYTLFVFGLLLFNMNNRFHAKKTMNVKEAVGFIKKNKTNKSIIIIQSKDIVPNFALYFDYSVFKKYWLIEEQLLDKNVISVNEMNPFLRQINFNKYDKVFFLQVFETAADPKKTLYNYINNNLRLNKKIRDIKGVNLHVFSTKHKSINSDSINVINHELHLNFYKQKITSDAVWLNHVKRKALENRINLDSALIDESNWLFLETMKKINDLK